MDSPPLPFPSSSRSSMRAPLALGAIVFLSYLSVLPGEFVWDDKTAIVGNPLVQDPRGLPAIWTTVGIIPNESHWWPLTYTAFWIEQRLFGPRPALFHLVNMLLHAGVSIQLWRLLRRIAVPGGAWGAFLGAALFAIHPVHAEPVAWITELKGLLSALLGLLAVGAFLDYGERPSRAAQVRIMLAIAGAMLAKSTAVVFPAGMALLAWQRRGKLSRADLEALVPAALSAIAMAFIDWRISGSIDRSVAVPPPLALRLAEAGSAFWMYVAKLLWPFGLSVVYPPFKADPSRFAAWLPLIAALAATSALWAARRRIGRGPLACWLFYAVALGPTLGLLHFSFLEISPVADRYQYIASLAPLAGAGAILGVLLEKVGASRRPATFAAIALAFVLLGAQTARQARLFRSQIALFAEAARIAPDSYFAYNNLAVGLVRAGRLEEGAAAMERARRLDEPKIERSGNLAFALMQLGRDAEAAHHYRRGIALDPLSDKLTDGLAWLLATSSDLAVRKPAEALALAGEVNRRQPLPNAGYLDTLAAAQAAAGDFAGAASNARLAGRLAIAAGEKGFAAEIGDRLKSYEAGRPYLRPASQSVSVPR